MDFNNTPLTTAFNKGMAEVASGKKRALTDDLKKALGIKARQTLYQYRDGKQQMSVPQMFAVWQTFARYGVADPWGGKVQ